MKTNQPKYKLIANLGDASPIDHGGYFIFIDETGVYDPSGEYLIAPDDDGKWTLYRFSLDKCTFINGVLSENKFHPELSAWFAKPEEERATRPQDTTYLSNVCACMDMDLDELRRLFCSDDVTERAQAYQAVGAYHGFENLDSYPETMNRAEVEERFSATLAELKKLKA